jgi:hypothetical protein
VTSCGCRKIEAARENMAKHCIKPRHGMTGTPTHKTWSSMIERCDGDATKPSHRPYVGIEVCDRWKLFENFLEDMGKRPTGMTLDRIDCRGNYEPNNCRWATAKQQQRNRSNTRYLFANGERVALMELAERFSIKKSAAQYFFSVFSKLQSAGVEVRI